MNTTHRLHKPILAILTAVAAAGPVDAAPAGDFQAAVDSFRRCQVHRSPLAATLLRSAGGLDSAKTRLKRDFGAEIAGEASYEVESDFRTGTIRPVAPAIFAGLPVTSLAATTCKGGECGMAVYWLNFERTGAADRRQLKAAVAQARSSKPRLGFVDHGAKGASLVCDMWGIDPV